MHRCATLGRYTKHETTHNAPPLRCVCLGVARTKRRTVTCYLPGSDPQCHGAKIEKEADQGRDDAESPVRVTLGN